MARKSTWITAGLLSAAAAGAGALLAYRKRHQTSLEQHLETLPGFDPHGTPKHKKERLPRKLKKSRAHADAVLSSGHGGQHW